MHIIFYFTIGCAIIGALGVGIASLGADEELMRRRWTRYYSYVFTTLVVIVSIFYQAGFHSYHAHHTRRLF
jgi:hypothetical protein